MNTYEQMVTCRTVQFTSQISVPIQVKNAKVFIAVLAVTTNNQAQVVLDISTSENDFATNRTFKFFTPAYGYVEFPSNFTAPQGTELSGEFEIYIRENRVTTDNTIKQLSIMTISRRVG